MSLGNKWIAKLGLRWRLTLLFILIFGLSQFLFSYALFSNFSRTLQQEFDDALFNYAVDVAAHIDLSDTADALEDPPKIASQKIFPFSLGTALILIRHISGVVLAKEGDFGEFLPPYQEDFKTLKAGAEAAYQTLDVNNSLPAAEAQSYRLISFPIDSSPQLVLQIAVPLIVFENQLHSLQNLISWGLPLVLLIATFLGYFLAARALRPVTDIVDLAQRVNAQDLSARLPVPLAKDEISRLSLTLNEMFSRIEKAFQSQERFVADASHQLLSPLSILKADLEAQMRGHTALAAKDLLSEVNQLIRIVKDMLLLSRVDAGAGALQLSEILFDDLLIEKLPRLQALAKASGKNIHFEIEDRGPNGKIRVDRDLLGQLVFILVENAIKYSDPNSVIVIKLSWLSDCQRLEVLDQGPGINKDEIDSIFERFKRGQGGKAEGFGLGLAIAKKIAYLLGGKIWAEKRSDIQGSRFIFEIKNN